MPTTPAQEGTSVIPGRAAAFNAPALWHAPVRRHSCSRSSYRTSVRMQPSKRQCADCLISSCLGQSHSSLNGGSLGHGGKDDVLAPLPPPPDAERPPDAEPLLDPETLLVPYPFVFGPVTVLQNVAVISSMQKVPVTGACVGAGWALWPPNCVLPLNCVWPFDVTTCAAAGEAAKTNPAINTSLFIMFDRLSAAGARFSAGKPSSALLGSGSSRRELEIRGTRARAGTCGSIRTATARVLGAMTF